VADEESRKGTIYHDPEILAWVQDVHAEHDRALRKAFEAPERLGIPPIHVGPSEGRLLHLLLRMVGALRVVEVGTLAGYSAIWMARALPEGGHLWTVEGDPRHAAVAREDLASADLLDRVTVVEGSALEILPSLEMFGPFDALFLDADKGNYDRYGQWGVENLRPGGLLLADNAFYFGKLLGFEPEAAAVRRLHLEAREHFHTACIPTPDGLLLGIRKSAAEASGLQTLPLE
jgi:predicted O-methyltransferase YrrM